MSDDAKNPDEPEADEPEAADDGASDTDAADGVPASTEEPIEAEFEPADGVFKRFTERDVSMSVVLIAAAAAAVVGGFLGVVLDGGGSGGVSQAQIDAAVERRLAPIDERLRDLRQTIAASPEDGGGVAAAALRDIDNEIATLRDEVAATTNRLRVVESARGNGEASAALAAQLEGLEADVQAAQQMAEEAIAAPSAQAAEIDTLATRLDALSDTARAQGRAIEQLSETSAMLASRVTGVRAPAGFEITGAAAAIAFAGLQDAALSGDPFPTEAAEASAFFVESEPMDRLVALSETGAPTPAELVASFRSAARAARAAELPSGGGFVDRLGQLVASVVTVRRQDAPETDTVSDVLVRAQRRLADSDLAGAAAELDRLDGEAGDAVELWVAQARARVQIEASLEALQSSFSEG